MTINLYRALQDVLPKRPLQVAEVVLVNVGQNTSVVQSPGGSQQLVRGSEWALGVGVFVRDGVIEGEAPALSAVTIEI